MSNTTGGPDFSGNVRAEVANAFTGNNTMAGTLTFTDAGIARYAANVLRITDGAAGIRALLGGGAAVASAAALPVPTGGVFHVTGVAAITSITSTNFQAGCVITIIFDGILTFTHGGNIKLAGAANFVTAVDSAITLMFDGTNWYELSRKA